MSGFPGTIDPVLVCREPGSPGPDPLEIGPFSALAPGEGGIYHVPQPPRGFRPVLKSLSFTARTSALDFDVAIAPRWLAAWLPPRDAPDSPGRVDQIATLLGSSPGAHVFFFQPAFPDADAAAIVYLANGGHGYVPPLDATGRFWGLLAGAAEIGDAIVTISPNWSVERDPSYVLTGMK